jgi:hypothetical protein
MSHFISIHEIMITQVEADAHYAGLTDETEKAAFKEMYANTLGGFVTTDVSDAEDVGSVAKRALETNDVEQKTMLNTNLATRLNGTGSNFAGGKADSTRQLVIIAICQWKSVRARSSSMRKSGLN